MMCWLRNSWQNALNNHPIKFINLQRYMWHNFARSVWSTEIAGCQNKLCRDGLAASDVAIWPVALSSAAAQTPTLLGLFASNQHSPICLFGKRSTSKENLFVFKVLSTEYHLAIIDYFSSLGYLQLYLEATWNDRLTFQMCWRQGCVVSRIFLCRKHFIKLKHWIEIAIRWASKKWFLKISLSDAVVSSWYEQRI